MRMRGGLAMVVIAGVVASGCAIRLGGPKPEAYEAAAVLANGTDAAELGARLRSSSTDLLLLAADQDSAWFARVGEAVGLTLSGPGRTGNTGLAIYSRLKILGDTALALPIQSGGRLHMQDALFEIEEDRFLDLMLVEIEAGAETRDAVRTLLNYYATDVGNSAAVLLGVKAPTMASADSVALLLRSAFGNAAACDEGASVTVGASTLRLFYGPQARIECERGAVMSGTPPGVAARVVVGR